MPIHPVRPIIIITLKMLGPTTAITARIRKNRGKQSIISAKRMIKESILPPKYPATEPRITPITAARPTATKPIKSAIRAAYTILEKRSLPRESVPSRCSADGRSNASFMSIYVGSDLDICGAKIAIIRRQNIIPAPNTVSLFLKNFFIVYTLCADPRAHRRCRRLDFQPG